MLELGFENRSARLQDTEHSMVDPVKLQLIIVDQRELSTEYELLL